MGVYAFFNLRRAEEERLKAARARTATERRSHMHLASLFEQRARQLGEAD